MTTPPDDGQRDRWAVIGSNGAVFVGNRATVNEYAETIADLGYAVTTINVDAQEELKRELLTLTEIVSADRGFDNPYAVAARRALARAEWVK